MKFTKQIRIRVDEGTFNQIQNYINQTGLNITDFMRLSITGFLGKNCRNDINDDNSTKYIEYSDIDGYIEDLRYDFEQFRRVTSSNNGLKLFKNSLIPDRYIIDFGGSVFHLQEEDKIILENYFRNELGFDQSHEIDFKSPLIGLLHTYNQFYLNNRP